MVSHPSPRDRKTHLKMHRSYPSARGQPREPTFPCHGDICRAPVPPKVCRQERHLRLQGRDGAFAVSPMGLLLARLRCTIPRSVIRNPLCSITPNNKQAKSTTSPAPPKKRSPTPSTASATKPSASTASSKSSSLASTQASRATTSLAMARASTRSRTSRLGRGSRVGRRLGLRRRR